ncbi:MAG: hypothetical protein G01um101417_339 [Parcubacteria group bacterium Gr01-1014_17]|nr:MAG: hypothetical protein G01um101417_339 [Parcubacteria group bacterium Gr01-1014_17]
MYTHSRLVLFLLAFSLAAPLAASAARPVRFSEAHPQYMAALARALAQEVATDVENNQADLDEDFSPEDFGLTGVGFLPNNPLYIFKAARRGFSDVFTTNPQAKLENSLRFAAEKLLEAKTLSEQGARETAVASALDSFRSEVERARARAEAASAKLSGSEAGAEIAHSMMDAVIKYQKLIGRIEKGTSGNAVEAATEAKERAGEALGAAFAFVPQEDAASTLSEVLDAQQGSDFRDFKNIEVLKTVEQSVPEAARPAIRAAAESALIKLEDNISSGESGSRAAFGDFLRNVGGNEARHLEIIQELEVRPLSDDARTALIAAKEEVLSRTEERLSGLSEDDKRSFLSHLNEGNIEDVRVVKELEKNVSAEALADVTDIASSAKENFARRVENAATDSGEKAKLLESVERFHDAKSLSVLDEIAALIPPEQQAVFLSLRQKATAEIQKDISRARGASEIRALYQALGGDHPEEFTALESFGGISDEVVEGIRSATTEQIKARAGVIRDETRFGRYEEALRASSGETGVSSGELSAFFAEQRDVYGSREKAEQKIADAATLVSELSALAGSLPLNLGYGEDGFDPAIRDAARFLSSAERRLANARAALARSAFGLAYGEAREAEFAARDGANIARGYKSGKRSGEEKPKTDVSANEWRLYNRYEFQKFCISFGGTLSDALSCTYEDDRVFTVNKDAFPVSVPVAFRPTEKRIVPQPEPVVDPEKPIPLPVLDPTKSGRCGGKEQYSCPSDMLCVTSKYVPAVVGDASIVYGSCVAKGEIEKRKDISCQAYFEGYVYDSTRSACARQSQSGCSNPFIYKTKDACELGIRAEERPDTEARRWVEHTWKFADGVETSMILDRTDSEYLGYIKNTEIVCRLMPKQQFLWRRGAGNDSADNWKNFGIPDCSGGAFSPATCGNNICELGETVSSCSKDCKGGTSVGDLYSCPGFAYELIDSKGKRYCKLNNKYSCNATYPQFLYESSYTPSLCPNELVTGDLNTTSTTTTGVQFGNCGANVSSYSCEASSACDWYVPTRGSPYCAPAVRGSWVSHTWRFTDGTETSSILSRIDREYSEFVASVDAQCKTISRNKFAWKVGAGNDAADNWQNFGIPDCTGTATNTSTTGGDMIYRGDATSCPGFAYSKWDSSSRRYCQLNTERKCDYNYPSYLVYGPNYKTENCPAEDSGGGTATTTTGTPSCSDGRDNDSDGQIDYPQDTGCYSAFDNDETIPTGTGGGGSTTCDSALTALLGTGCHQMYTDSSGSTIFCDSSMTKSAKRGDTTTTIGCSGPGGSGTGTSACSDGKDNDGDGQIDYPQDTGCYGPADTDEAYPTGGGGTSTMQKCFYPNASKSGTSLGYTVWCQSDYVDCHEGSPSGASISLTGVSLGAPSQCESGWTGGPSGSCNSNNFCDTWESATSCPKECGSSSSGTPAIPTGVTATSNANTDGTGVTISWTDASTNETSFKVWRQVSGSWSSLTSVPSAYNLATGGLITYNDTNAPSGSVSYQIQACNATICSQDSALTTVWVAGGGGLTAGYCGDRICQSSESSASCSVDCGSTGGGTTTSPACSDGKDNDGDGLIDYPQDTGCYSASDPDEIVPPGGGSGTSTTCSSALITLLGDGCHQMYTDSSGNTIFCDSSMTKSAKSGDSATTSGCTGPGGGGTTSSNQCSDGTDNDGDSFIDAADPGCQNGGTSETYYGSGTTCSSGQYWNGSACVSSSPSSSASTCGNNSCESGETTSSCPADCGSTSTYTTCAAGTSWNGTSCVSACSSGQTWNGTSCVTSTAGASIWQAFGSWLKGE